MSRRRHLIFAYLAVCPSAQPTTTADGKNVDLAVSMRVESVGASTGNLVAKLGARNKPENGAPTASKWRALFGFHTPLRTYKQHVRPIWNRSLKNGWQEALREGLRLGAKYSEGFVYVSENAVSNPPCPILQCVQRMAMQSGDEAHKGIAGAANVFWETTMSKDPLKGVKAKLKVFLKDFDL